MRPKRGPMREGESVALAWWWELPEGRAVYLSDPGEPAYTAKAEAFRRSIVGEVIRDARDGSPFVTVRWLDGSIDTLLPGNLVRAPRGYVPGG